MTVPNESKITSESATLISTTFNRRLNALEVAWYKAKVIVAVLGAFGLGGAAVLTSVRNSLTKTQETAATLQANITKIKGDLDQAQANVAKLRSDLDSKEG